MRPTKKAERAMEKLTAMLAASGVKVEEIQEMKETAPTGREAVSMQAEAVLLFLESPAKFTQKQCKREECGDWFGTNYRSVGYCSDTCRSKEMTRQLGIKWNYFKTEHERWGGEPPLIVPPAALQKIQQYVAWFADNLPTENQKENLPEPTPTVLSEESDREAACPEVQQQLSEAHTNHQQSLLELSQEQESEAESPFDFA